MWAQVCPLFLRGGGGGWEGGVVPEHSPSGSSSKDGWLDCPICLLKLILVQTRLIRNGPETNF